MSENVDASFDWMVLQHSVEGVEKELDVRGRVQLVRALLAVDEIHVLAADHLADLE